MLTMQRAVPASDIYNVSLANDIDFYRNVQFNIKYSMFYKRYGRRYSMMFDYFSWSKTKRKLSYSASNTSFKDNKPFNLLIKFIFFFFCLVTTVYLLHISKKAFIFCKIVGNYSGLYIFFCSNCQISSKFRRNLL